MAKNRLLQGVRVLLADFASSSGVPTLAQAASCSRALNTVTSDSGAVVAAANSAMRTANSASAGRHLLPPLVGSRRLPGSPRLLSAAVSLTSRLRRRHSRLFLAVRAAHTGQPRMPGNPAAGLHTRALPAALSEAPPAAVVPTPLPLPRILPQQPYSYPSSSYPANGSSNGSIGGVSSARNSISAYRVNGSGSGSGAGTGSRPAAAAATAAASDVSVEGTVQKITYRSADTAYTVMRLQLASGPGGGSSSSSSSSSSRRRQRVITVVGTLPQVAVGQSLRLRGSWVEHRQYGQQLRAIDLEELQPASDGEMVAYLGGGAIPGVGPVTAQRLVDRWGTAIESKLNSGEAVQHLQQCAGIGRARAEKIKAAWDATKGTRAGVMFLKDHGIPLPLAQRISERFGPHTAERVAQDPYTVLAGFGLPFSKVDQLAAKVGAPSDLVSRAAMAMQQCLAAAAAGEGHTFLPWSRVERECGRLLREVAQHHGLPWQHAQALHLVAQHMHANGTLVAEPAAAAQAAAAAAQAAAEVVLPAAEAASQPVEAAAAAPAAAAAVRQHPSFDGIAELKGYLCSKLKGISSAAIDSMLSTHGEGLLRVLDSGYQQALEQLCLCHRIGPKTSEKIKVAWEAAHGGSALLSAARADAAGAAAASGLSGRPGLTMQQLIEAPPGLPFVWAPDTRCYSPHLYAAEQTVAERSLQRARLYKPASTRQLNRVRKWVQANQAATDLQLNEGQVRAIEVASDAPLMVLTGGPGCGKTTAVQTIVKLWCAQNKVVRIAAPTGRAAQRMGEIQGIEPCTIHRLLGYQPRKAGGSGSGGEAGGAGGSSSSSGAGSGGVLDLDDAAEEAGLGSQGVFTYNRSNPLPADAVLVDEASMLSLPLAAALVDALHPRCQLVLVGDVDQLPPIGPGAVLHNLIASRLAPVVDLRQIFRQAAQSAIITSALAVRRGKVPVLQPVQPTPASLEAATSDALLVQAGRPEDLAAAVKDTVSALRQAQGYTGNRDEAADLQVISPMRKGPAGTAVLNPMLQALLNPPHPSKPELPRHPHAHSHSTTNPAVSTTTSEPAAAAADGQGDTAAAAVAVAAGVDGGRVFRQGDRVIQQVNNYDKEVFNGDQGRVVSVSPASRSMVVHFPHLQKAGGSEQGALRTYQGVELGQLELAYAVTVHKAQGGEAQQVVLALSPQHGRMLTRRLLYTGLTRAKRQLLVVAAGSGSAADPLARAVRRKEGEARLTWLQGRLEEGRQAGGLAELAAQCYSNEEDMLQLQDMTQGAAKAGQGRQPGQGLDEAEGQELLPAPGVDVPSVPAGAAVRQQQQYQQQQYQQEQTASQQQQAPKSAWELQQQAEAEAALCADAWGASARACLTPASMELAATQLRCLVPIQEGRVVDAREADRLVHLLLERCPRALLAIPRAMATLIYLQQQEQLMPGLTLELVATRAPLLLEVDVVRVATAMLFLKARQDRVDPLDPAGQQQQQHGGGDASSSGSNVGGSPSSIIDSLRCLWAGTQGPGQQGQQLLLHADGEALQQKALLQQQQEEQEERVHAAAVAGGMAM